MTAPSPEVLAIIPARGGSKGIPHKNIVDVCGKPLLAYSIECALKSAWKPRVVVSTDDEEIAAVAREHGAQTPFLRPRELSGGRAHLDSAVHHAVNSLAADGYRADVHCILLPPHLFRTPRTLDLAVGSILEGYHQVQTLRPVRPQGTVWFHQEGNGRLTPLRPTQPGDAWSAEWYRPYGYMSVFSTVDRPRGIKFLQVTDPIECIDIDTPDDLELAREVIAHNLYDFDAR